MLPTPSAFQIQIHVIAVPGTSKDVIREAVIAHCNGLELPAAVAEVKIINWGGKRQTNPDGTLQDCAWVGRLLQENKMAI